MPLLPDKLVRRTGLVLCYKRSKKEGCFEKAFNPKSLLASKPELFMYLTTWDFLNCYPILKPSSLTPYSPVTQMFNLGLLLSRSNVCLSHYHSRTEIEHWN